MSLVLGGATVVLLYWIGYEFWYGYKWGRVRALVAPAFLAANPSLLYWSASGLETTLFTFATILVLYLIVVESRLARQGYKLRWLVSIIEGLACATVCLIRPEGIALTLFCVGSKIFMWNGHGRWVWQSLLVLLMAFVPVGIYLLWRHSYYDYWLPNTYYAKMSGSIGARVRSGIMHMNGWSADNAFGWLGRNNQFAGAGYFLFFLIPMVGVIFVRRKRAHLLVLLYCLMQAVAVVWMGGDWMPA